MFIEIQTSAGSDQFIPGILTTAGEIMWLVSASNELNTAVAGKLRALPI